MPDSRLDLNAIRRVCEQPGGLPLKTETLASFVPQLLALIEEAQDLLMTNAGPKACWHCDGDKLEHAVACPLAAWLAKVC